MALIQDRLTEVVIAHITAGYADSHQLSYAPCLVHIGMTAPKLSMFVRPSVCLLEQCAILNSVETVRDPVFKWQDVWRQPDAHARLDQAYVSCIQRSHNQYCTPESAAKQK